MARSRGIHETPRISFLGQEERSVYDQERGGGSGGGTGTIYDVSKTSIRRSLTPIVAFHAVRVSLPKLYCRKADFTRAESFPSVRDLLPPLLQGRREGGGVTARRGNVGFQHADVLRRISRVGRSRSPRLFLLPSSSFSRLSSRA